ncbi:MerR family transcriptional regulator [Streptomyces sp. NPDC098781]|uniref:MerR family transcriptional regulator n=1 Tax=Streptomyces sp. NPDC098781 TaxID=3366097 RepID=UPI0038139991
MSSGDDVEPGRAAGLTTGEVARRLGVAPTTIRSWDRRYGLGPDARMGGRHRRWSPADVARLERMCALTATGLPPAEAARLALDEGAPRDEGSPLHEKPIHERPRHEKPPHHERPPHDEEPPKGDQARRRPAPPSRPAAARGRGKAGSGLRLGDVRQECKGVARAALRLDANALEQLLAGTIAEHGLVTAWTEVIMPTLQAVGRKWESSGERYVEVEHFLSWHVSGALRRSAPPDVADRPGAVTLLACVPGETHTLPLEVLAAALAERGVPVRMFGGAVPAESLVAAVRRIGPAAVCLWAQSRTTASWPLAQYVAAMEWGIRGARRRPAVLPLGPGWAGRTVPGLVPRPTGLAEAVTAVESLVPG